MPITLTKDALDLLEYSLLDFWDREGDDYYNLFTKEDLESAKAWLAEQMTEECPRDEIRQPCPHCKDFTVIWKFPQELGRVNTRKCDHCKEWFVSFNLHPDAGTQQMTQQQYRDWLRERL